MSTIFNNQKYFDTEPYNTLFPKPQVQLRVVTGRAEDAKIFPGALCQFAPSTYANGYTVNETADFPSDLSADLTRLFQCMIPPYMENYPTEAYPKGYNKLYSAGDNIRLVEWVVNMEGWLYCNVDGVTATGLTATTGQLLTSTATDGEVVHSRDTIDSTQLMWSVLYAITGKSWVYCRCLGYVRGDAA